MKLRDAVPDADAVRAADLPPNFDRWFWTRRFVRFAAVAGVAVGVLVGMFLGAFPPVLALLLGVDRFVPLEQVLRDVGAWTMTGAVWGAALLVPVTVPIGIMLDWTEWRRMSDAEDAVNEIRNLRLSDRKDDARTCREDQP